MSGKKCLVYIIIFIIENFIERVLKSMMSIPLGSNIKHYDKKKHLLCKSDAANAEQIENDLLDIKDLTVILITHHLRDEIRSRLTDVVQV